MIAKKLLPRSLFGRTLLILVLPMVLVQLIMAYVFFERHWDNIIRRMSSVLAGEAAFLAAQVRDLPPLVKPPSVRDFESFTDITVFIDTADSFSPGHGTSEFPEFQELLDFQIDAPFTVRRIEGGSTIEIRIALPDKTLRLETPVKRLESRTTLIFLLWMVGASFLFLLIAVLFLRNQIRPIRRLASAADNFGRGVDTPGFRPQGASEVRRASRAFIVMRERIKRQLRTRTEMLAGISHDLRTPLTRMKLQLAMLENSEAARELSDDVQQMEHMIQEYLDFARGEGREEAVSTSLGDLLEDVVEDYRRLAAPVTLAAGDDIEMELRISGIRRMLHNVIDNAIKHGKRCEVSWRRAGKHCEILIDDDGPGIPPDKREEVFKPFSRLDASRNTKTGGVGLGLTITRDIVMAHGGGISLETSPLGGLRVIIRLPL
jgi:two-component system, OmpR family, osmolarity sensor histidine kinase EnvZ